ncbi:MAG: hypothetical protein K9J83_03020 [Desulfarculaceae bacterium]|nr:hypothetical protein [Desulfarculaceae bacterium]
MNDPADIRDRRHLTGHDILALNFVKTDVPFVFRRHFREGLRSHIFELHDPESVALEKNGVMENGVRIFPRSVPFAMLRLMRYRFSSAGEALAEIERFHTLLRFLTTDFVADSEEFVVDYRIHGKMELLLCGFQEYVAGEVFDPWAFERYPGTLSSLADQVSALRDTGMPESRFLDLLERNARRFVAALKQMMDRAGLIPDLSGVGNLIVTKDARLKLVDINNISRVCFTPDVYIDDKGYPVCDKSVEVLAILEEHFFGTPRPDMIRKDPVYRVFLEPDRLGLVREKEKAFLKKGIG